MSATAPTKSSPSETSRTSDNSKSSRRDTPASRNRFIRLQVGLFDHIADGRFTPVMLCVYAAILRQVNFKTGFWHGSAPKIVAAWSGQLKERTVQRTMERLGDEDYLKLFHHRGRRGNYWVGVNKYPIRSGQWQGYRLNTSATVDPEHPVYELDPRDGHRAITDNQSDTPSARYGGRETFSSEITAPPALSQSVVTDNPPAHSSLRVEEDETSWRSFSDNSAAVSTEKTQGAKSFTVATDGDTGRSPSPETVRTGSSPSSRTAILDVSQNQDTKTVEEEKRKDKARDVVAVPVSSFSSNSTPQPGGRDPETEHADELREIMGDFREWLDLPDGAKPDKFIPANAGLWSYHTRRRLKLANSFLSWLAKTWPDLNLTKSQRDAIRASFYYIEASEEELTASAKRPYGDGYSIIEEAARWFLEDLDVADTFAHAGSKLSAGLFDKFEGVRHRHAERRTQAEQLERARQQGRAAAEAELAAREAEEAPVEDELPL